MKNELSLGQIILIKKVKYVVAGIMRFNEKSDCWTEYKLNGILKKQTLWLEEEETNASGYDDVQYTVYETSKELRKNVKFYRERKELEYNGITYSLHEQGKCSVTNAQGTVDVCDGDKCEYEQYIDLSNQALISYECWEDEKEFSIGYVLDVNDLELTDEKDMRLITREQKKKVIGTICLIAVAAFILYFLVPSKVQISKYIENSSKYTYVTSLTNSINNEIARVYESSGTLDETVRDIIEGASAIKSTVEAATDVDGDEAEQGIGLISGKEYAYVYYTEDEKVYVQVSSNKFMNNDMNAYRSSSHTHRYSRTYSRYRVNSTYAAYSKSIRSSSVGTRTRTGGSTHSGK